MDTRELDTRAELPDGRLLRPAAFL
jgi:hypothetical protein